MTSTALVPAEAVTPNVKAYVIDTDTQTSNAASATEDDSRVFLNYGAIQPPYDPRALYNMFEKSTALRPNIDAYRTNIEGFGHRLKATINLDAPDADDRLGDALMLEAIADEDPTPQASAADVAARRLSLEGEMRLEKLRLEQFFTNCAGDISFVELRKRTRQDLEVTGNAYWEVLRDGRGRPSRLVLLPAVSMRLMRAETSFTQVTQLRKVSAIAVRRAAENRRLRRFVQVLFGQFCAYFKELDDPRLISSRTGKVYASWEEFQHDEPGMRPATEVLHFKIHSALSAYGIPRWIGASLSVIGSRASEEVNVTYFDNKAVPPMAILVSGGTLAKGMADRITDYIRTNIKGRDNFHSVLVLEAEPFQGGSLSGQNGSRCRIEIKNLMDSQLQDALFQEYDANNTEKVGNQFRLPKLIRGDMKDFNRACYSADTETLTERGWKLHHEIASDEKVAVFDPERMCVRFEVPAAKHVYDVDEELIHFSGQHTDVLVTNDHKMLARCPDRSWVAEPASVTATRSRFEFICAPDEDVPGEALASFTLPKTCKIERGHDHAPVAAADWLEFLGYYLSDGGLLETDHPTAPYLVFVRQKKQPHQDRMRACIERIGWAFSETVKSDGTVVFTISNRCLRDWLVRACGGRSAGRRMPAGYAERLPREQLTVLWAAMKAGDGGAGRQPTNGCYYSASRELADAAQIVAFRLGLRASVRWQDEAGAFRVMWSENRTTQLDNEHVSRVAYKGEVYCFSCPGAGFFVTRRHGKIAIQGNTADAALDYAEQQVFDPERREMDHIINHRIVVQLDGRFHELKSQGVQTKDQPQLAEMIRGHVERGIITPNEARALSGDVFGENFPHVDAPWGDQPPALALAAAAAAAKPDPAQQVQAQAQGLLTLRSKLAELEGARGSAVLNAARTTEAAKVHHVPAAEFQSWFAE